MPQPAAVLAWQPSGKPPLQSKCGGCGWEPGLQHRQQLCARLPGSPAGSRRGWRSSAASACRAEHAEAGLLPATAPCVCSPPLAVRPVPLAVTWPSARTRQCLIAARDCWKCLKGNALVGTTLPAQKARHYQLRSYSVVTGLHWSGGFVLCLSSVHKKASRGVVTIHVPGSSRLAPTACLCRCAAAEGNAKQLILRGACSRPGISFTTLTAQPACPTRIKPWPRCRRSPWPSQPARQRATRPCGLRQRDRHRRRPCAALGMPSGGGGGHRGGQLWAMTADTALRRWANSDCSGMPIC